jgi:hypothetical protein
VANFKARLGGHFEMIDPKLLEVIGKSVMNPSCTGIIGSGLVPQQFSLGS